MRNLPDIVKAIALNNKVDESRELARFVQDSLHAQLKKGDKTLRNLGVKQAPFMVLVGATMPAILTEVAFVTNQQDAARLRSANYRQEVAAGALARHHALPAVAEEGARPRSPRSSRLSDSATTVRPRCGCGRRAAVAGASRRRL